MSIDEGRVRASDAEREQYARLVREATGEGRLSLDEGDERLGQVYAARFRDELPGLVADLPAGRDLREQAVAGPTGPPPWADRRTPQGPPPWARRRPYGPPLFPVLLLTGLLVGLWAATDGHFFWPAIPLVIFALIMLRRARWRRWRR